MAIDRRHLIGRGFEADVRIFRDMNGAARGIVFDRVDLDLGTKTTRIMRDEYGRNVVRSFEHPQSYRPPPQPPSYGQPAHRVRGTGSGIVRFELLGQIRGALSQTLAANRALIDGTSWSDRRDTAEDLASAVLQTLGLELPPVIWSPGHEASALAGRIHMGEDLARTLSLPALTQILLHEAGHVHEGHTCVAANLVLHALRQEGYLSDKQFGRMMRDEERVADVYAALGAWMFDPGQRPAMSEWLAATAHPRTDTHPSSAERAQTIALIVHALDRAAFEGAFDAAFPAYNGQLGAHQPWAFGDDAGDGGPFGGGDGGE